jgi:hypothetical protein
MSERPAAEGGEGVARAVFVQSSLSNSPLQPWLAADSATRLQSVCMEYACPRRSEYAKESMMKTRRSASIAGLALFLQFGFTLFIRAADNLPAELSDEEFWKLSTESSEADGSFRSDNLLSNELYFQYVIPQLSQLVKPGRVYIGVGPEQNFTYIAALKPKMVFIVDIRRGNLDLQLMYKALFEMSKNRVEFVSRLFSRTEPEGLGPQSTAQDIFEAILTAPASDDVYTENLKAIQEHLMKKHGFPLSENDLGGIEWVVDNFRRFGARINYGSSGRGNFGNGVTYADLMTATDADGTSRSYLANEENFNVLKALEMKNLIVPVVGNFAGTKAIRAVGKYVRGQDASISAFYLSNVEQYLQQDGIWDDFCRNVATLPLDDSSTFIRSVRGGRFGLGSGLNSDLGNMMSEVKSFCSTEK